MTNPIAIVLGLILLGGIITDVVMSGGSNLLFLAKKFTEFTDWIAFWR
ncbi:hypothetical protein [Planktotalea sp.]